MSILIWGFSFRKNCRQKNAGVYVISQWILKTKDSSEYTRRRNTTYKSPTLLTCWVTLYACCGDVFPPSQVRTREKLLIPARGGSWYHRYNYKYNYTFYASRVKIIRLLLRQNHVHSVSKDCRQGSSRNSTWSIVWTVHAAKVSSSSGVVRCKHPEQSLTFSRNIIRLLFGFSLNQYHDVTCLSFDGGFPPLYNFRNNPISSRERKLAEK